MTKQNEFGMTLNHVKAAKAIQNRDQQIILSEDQPGHDTKCFSVPAWDRIMKQYQKHPQLMQDENGYWAFVEFIPEPAPDDILSHGVTGGAELKAVKAAKESAKATSGKNKAQQTIE